MKIKYTLWGLLFLTACNSPESSKETIKAEGTADNNAALNSVLSDGCYQWTLKQDTATLKISVKDGKVTGNLIYDWNEKDRNSGTINGIVKDSLIVGDYTFQSEGMTSVREIVFKIKDSVLIEGYGDIDTKSDTVRFKNISNLKFQEDRPFIKIKCEE